MPETETETDIKRITFRLSPELYQQAQLYLAGRRAREPKYSMNDLCLEAVETLTNPRSQLTRYRDLLAFGRLTLRQAFSEAELNLVMDACNGFALWFELGEGRRILTQPGRMIAIEVEDSVRLNGLDAKWKVNGPELVGKLNGLDLPAQYALADLIERFWEDPQATVMQLL